MRCVIYLRVSTREQVEKGEGEEGFSIPAQREACTRHIRDAGWSLVDEYVDRGESARSADRPALKEMLARIAEERDVDAVVVHKIDRLARNMEDHVAIRALLRRRSVALVSVTENVEETASGRLVEGIHALMAEFYSANLASEIRKGLSQKAKMGGFPHGAPLGYVNLREVIAGRQVARIVPDAERAPLITLAFEHYATGEWTLQRLAGELAHRGLRNRARRDHEPKAVTWQGLAKILANPVYVGIVEWNGVRHPGTHEPLAGPETFRRVQELLGARAARGTRERKHPHYLKGLLHCGVCGRRLSIQHSKGRYTYFFCLGQKNDPKGTCREHYVAAENLEAQVEELYHRIQLPIAWADRLRADMADEIVERQRADAAQRELLTRRLAKAEAQRHKLLDAYYGGAIDVPTLKTEQTRIGADIDAAKDRLGDLDANLGEWQEILELAATLATRCGDAYRKAKDRARKQFNAAVFERLDVKDGRLCHEQYRPPFDDIFSVCGFEYETRVETMGLEPTTSCVQSRRSSQLSYVPAVPRQSGKRLILGVLHWTSSARKTAPAGGGLRREEGSEGPGRLRGPATLRQRLRRTRGTMAGRRHPGSLRRDPKQQVQCPVRRGLALVGACD
jgi:site-specific DNA recombinase